MAKIQRYLEALEARLAPSLDAHALRERLTEAENHLRDRAQEFAEIGLPTEEAEARAVAAFGDPEEFAEDLRPRPETKVAAPRPRSEPPRRDLALQLAWSAVGLGLVSMLTVNHAYWVAAGFAVAVVTFGALLGRPTTILRMALLAAVAALAAFPILVGFYEPLPHNGYRPERLGVRLRGTESDEDYLYRQAKSEIQRFELVRQEFMEGHVIREGDRAYLGPASFHGEDDWRWSGAYLPYGIRSLETYDTPTEAALKWRTVGETLYAQLRETVERSRPIMPELTEFEARQRFALLAGAGAVGFLAAMVGAQSLGLALRGLLTWLFSGLRRRPERPARPSYYGEPERY